MPSTTSLPDQTAPMPGASAPAAGVSQFQRMEAELKVLQQQAQATQKSLQQLKTRESADPYAAIVSDLPSFSTLDSMQLGVASALVLACVVVWWYVWHRPSTHWNDAGDTRMQASSAMPSHTPTARDSGQPSRAPKNGSQGWAPSMADGEFSTAGFESSSALARQNPNMAFDSEAAATEVMRVRKSLADKREARAHYLDRDETTGADLALDLDLDEEHPPPVAQVWLDSRDTSPAEPALEPQTEPVSEPAVDLDLALDPWRMPGETGPGTSNDQSTEDLRFSLALEDYGLKSESPTTPATAPPSEPSMDPTTEAEVEIEEDAPQLALEPAPEPKYSLPDPAAKDYDFTITMALAEESAALELWTEARDLATEVLASNDATLVAQATSLLARLKQMEQDAPPDTNWGSVR